MRAGLILFALSTTALAHIQVQIPLTLGSKFDTSLPQSIRDEDATNGLSPMASDGSDYPCKGRLSLFAATSAKATLKVGSPFSLQLVGSATHNGGSCEISISYDVGKTFAVIKRFVGGCPLNPKLDFDVPDLPSSQKALLAWTWQNLSGNREEYMNCMAIAVQNSDSSVKTYSAPAVFRANTFADGSCRTVESVNVQYPQVNSVATEYADGESARSPETKLDNCAVDQSTTVTVGPGGSSSGGSVKRPGLSTLTKSRAKAPASSSISNPTVLSGAIASTTLSRMVSKVTRPTNILSGPVSASTVAPEKQCDSGKIICAKDGKTFSMCSNGSLINMGSVSAGTACRDGAITWARLAKHRRAFHY